MRDKPWLRLLKPADPYSEDFQVGPHLKETVLFNDKAWEWTFLLTQSQDTLWSKHGIDLEISTKCPKGPDEDEIIALLFVGST